MEGIEREERSMLKLVVEIGVERLRDAVESETLVSGVESDKLRLGADVSGKLGV